MILARLLSIAPQSDGEHWDIGTRFMQDVFNTDLYLQNPAPYQRNTSQLTTRNGPPYPWRPGAAGFGGTGGFYPKPYSFGVKVNTANSPTTLDIFGQVPVNAQPTIPTPQCPLQASVAITGGSIVTGNYLLAISAGPAGPVSQYLIKAVMPAGTTAGTITISGVIWQAAAPAIAIYAGTHSMAMHSIVAGVSWTGSSPDTYGNPTVFTIVIIDPDGTGMPDTVFNSFLFQAKDIVIPGAWGALPLFASSVAGQVLTFPSVAWGTSGSGQWAGYTLVSYGAGSGIGGGSPYEWTVVSSTATTLTLGGSSAPAAGIPLVLRAAASSITASTIGDPNFTLPVNAQAGNFVRVVGGTGAGQPDCPIFSNSATVITLAGTWAVTPDATSQYIIVAPHWRYTIPTGTITNGGAGVPIGSRAASIPVDASFTGSLLIEAITVDVNGNWSIERYAPIREVWVPLA